jgi:endonuclease YncB( thermonuclease family)
MSPTLKTLLHSGLACLLACALHAQDAGAEKPGAELDFSKDPCGNPMMESQLWYSIDGKVSKVVDGHTILLALPDAPQILRVYLAGIALERRGPFSRTAKEHLGVTLLNKPVGILVNAEQWPAKRPKEVMGVVQLSEGIPSDVGLSLLAEGLVRFREPPPYTMSHHTMCQYRRAEAEAQSKKLGLWQ